MRDAGGGRLASWSQNHRTGDRDRGTDRALRVSMLLNVVLTFGILLSLTAFNVLLPLKRDEPWLLEVRSADQAVATVKPLRYTTSREEALAEYEVARYVRVRHTIVSDLSEMDRIWGQSCLKKDVPAGFNDADLLCSYMAVHSTPDVYAEFVSDIKPVKDFIGSGQGRRVKLLMDPIRKEPGVYEVRFAAIDYRPRPESSFAAKDGLKMAGEPETVRERKLSALVWVKPVEEEVERRHRHLNHSGLVVWKYKLSELQ